MKKDESTKERGRQDGRKQQPTHVLVHSHPLYSRYVLRDHAELLKYFVHNEDVTVLKQDNNNQQTTTVDTREVKLHMSEWHRCV